MNILNEVLISYILKNPYKILESKVEDYAINDKRFVGEIFFKLYVFIK